MDPQCLKGRVSSYSVSVVRCLRHTCYHHKNVFLYIPLCLVGEGHTPTTVSTGEISSQHTQTLSQMKSFSTFVVVGVVLVLLLEGWACAGPRPSPNQRGHNLPGFFVPVEQVAGIPARTDTTKHGKDRLVWSHATNFSHPIKGHHASLSYNAELAHGIINADLDTNVSELHCDNLAGKKDEESQISVSLVNSEALEATLQEWKVGDVLVASHLWGCSFQENKPQQAVYMKVQSLHRSASIPNGIDMMVKRAMLTHLFEKLKLDVQTNSIVDDEAVTGKDDQTEQSTRKSGRHAPIGTFMSTGTSPDNAKTLDFFSDVWDGLDDVESDLETAASDVGKVALAAMGGDVTWTQTKAVHLAWNTESGYTASSSKELEGFNVEMSGGVKCSQCFFYASGNYGGTVNIDKRELVSAFIGFTNSEVVASLGVQASGSVKVSGTRQLADYTGFP